MTDKISLSQVLYSQSKQRNELDHLRSEIKKIHESGTLDQEIEKLNRSPYVQDRPVHKLQMLLGSQEEGQWQKDLATRDQVDAAASLALKKLNII